MFMKNKKKLSSWTTLTESDIYAFFNITKAEHLASFGSSNEKSQIGLRVDRTYL